MTTNLIQATRDRIVVARNPEWIDGIRNANPFVLIADYGTFHREYDHFKTFEDITAAAQRLADEWHVNATFEEGLQDDI